MKNTHSNLPKSFDSFSKVRILHVDDEKEILELTRTFIEKKSARNIIVDVTNNPLEVMELLENNRYDIIISDYQMTPLTGLDLLEKVRTAFPIIPFIIFTGRGREEVAIKALNLGASFYIKKGDGQSQYDELLHVIKTIITRFNLEKALAESETNFKTLFEQMPVALAMYDIDGTLWAINPEGVDKWGAKGKPIIGEFNCFEDPMSDQLLIGTTPHTYPYYLSRALKGEAVSVPPTKFESDGKTLWMKGLIFPLVDRANNVKSIVTTRLDVTDLMESLERVDYLQQLLSLAMEQANVGILIINSTDGSIEFINTEAKELLGIPDDILTQINNDNSFLNYLTVKIEGKQVQSFQELPLVQASLEGRSTYNERHEITNYRGESFNIIINASPVIDEEGKRLGGFLIFKKN